MAERPDSAAPKWTCLDQTNSLHYCGMMAWMATHVLASRYSAPIEVVWYHMGRSAYCPRDHGCLSSIL